MIYTFDSIVLDTVNFSLKANNQSIHTEPLTFNLILYLLEHRDRPVSRGELFESLWPGRFVTEGSLTNEIKEARKLVGDDAHSQKIIKTLHGRGYQFVAPINKPANQFDLKYDYGVLNTLDPDQNIFDSIPIPNNEFIGRQDELEKISVFIRNPKNKLLSIVGPGGIGKTRLAIQLATINKIYFSEGITFIPLVSVLDPDEVINLIAVALNAPSSIFSNLTSERSRIRSLTKFVGQRKHLIVLDNFEHLSSAANMLASICTYAENIQFIVTTRERLNVSIEFSYVLEGLVFQKFSPIDDFDIAGDAIRLFCERVSHETTLDCSDQQNRSKIREICARLDGSPLGIEIAASWLRVMPLHELLEEISSDVLHLETEYQDIPNRHHNLGLLFESTWNRLDDDLQQAFMRLSLFIGGFSREAAKSVCHLSPKQLLNLERYCLIKKTEKGRFHIHELLRQFGENKLNHSSFQQNALESFALYYCDFADEKIPLVLGYSTLEIVDEVAEELANLQFVVSYLLKEKQWQHVKTITTLCCNVNRDYIRSFEFIREVVPQLKGHLNPADYQNILWLLLNCYLSLNLANEEYLDYCNEFIRLSKERNHLGLEGKGESYKSDYYLLVKKDEYQCQLLRESAYKKLKQYLETYNGDDTSEYGLLCIALGDEAAATDSLTDCKKYFLRSLQVGKNIGDRKLYECSNWGLAIAYNLLGDADRALEHCRLCLAYFLLFKNALGYAVRISGIAMVAVLKGDYIEATKIFGQGQGLIERITKRECPVETFCNESDLDVLKQQLGMEKFETIWAIGRQDAFKQIVKSVDTYIENNRMPKTQHLETLDVESVTEKTNLIKIESFVDNSVKL